MVKNPPANAGNAGDLGLIPVSGILTQYFQDTLEKEMATTPVFLLGQSHGQRSLVGYSPWDQKELDITEYTHAHFLKYNGSLFYSNNQNYNN